ncbi:MAG: hypothetical protein U5K74_07175 [Gemmatimonadaceae bacterium]|nr:hypothetical protein [Gemmatimonadaceae bacterium]
MPRATGTGRIALLLTAGVLPGVVTAVPLSAQARARVSGSVETGAAAVEQPLVRSGAAFYLAPGAQLTAHDATIGADAVFATGTPFWRSVLGNGFVRSPAVKGVRLIGGGQLLKTSGLLSTVHGDVGAEWRGSAAGTTALARARIGRLRYGGALWKDVDLGLSAFRSRGALVFALDGVFTDAQRPAALRQQIGVEAGGASAFTARTLDLTPRMIWERGRLRADGSLALRLAERGMSGTRVGPQLSFTVETNRGIALFAGGVQRLPDVRSGVPSGRSALLGMRVSGTRVVTRPVAPRRRGPSLHVIGGTLILDAGPTFVARAALRGDFTEWQARDCRPRDRDTFECGAAPGAGTWRVSIRLDDGAWQQPANLAAAADDFGSVDGLLMTGGKP